jgi:uncharacterized cysteine cluster protein YcgN (CxxCxxCC family)
MRAKSNTIFSDMSEQEWDDLCERCGVCCFEKIEDENGTIFFTQTPCRYLDIDTRLCKIYDRRFEINPECVKLSPQMIGKIPWLHDRCAYMKRFGIKGPSL